MKPATLAQRLGLLALWALPCLQVCAAEAKPTALSTPWFQEDNRWPLYVTRQTEDGTLTQRSLLAPWASDSLDAQGNRMEVLRPFWYHRESPVSHTAETAFLYPLFVYKTGPAYWHWSVFGLINGSSPQASTGEKDGAFDVWPVYFSRNTGRPESTYKAVFPVYGTLKSRLYNDRIDWVLFPFYGRFQSGEKVVHTVPWPFVKVISGGPNHGWSVWPLGGHREVAGRSESWYVLASLVYHDRNYAPADEARESYGVLPFYSGIDAPNFQSRTYLWPFFGWTERKGEESYSEQRYLWPFFLQGRGSAYRNRWAPFYTHSIVRGTDKTWVLWPLWRQSSWKQQGLDVKRSQLLWVVYWRQTEHRSGAKPGSPEGHKTHVWPFVSVWNNGAGTHQLQVLSPIEVFFQHNDETRQSWTPFFALYRQERRDDGELRSSALWNLFSYDRSRVLDRSRFTVGPLLSVSRQGSGRRVELLRGLLGWGKAPETGRWSLFVADFKSSTVSAPAAANPSKP